MKQSSVCEDPSKMSKVLWTTMQTVTSFVFWGISEERYKISKREICNAKYSRTIVHRFSDHKWYNGVTVWLQTWQTFSFCSCKWCYRAEEFIFEHIFENVFLKAMYTKPKIEYIFLYYENDYSGWLVNSSHCPQHFISKNVFEDLQKKLNAVQNQRECIITRAGLSSSINNLFSSLSMLCMILFM